VKTLASNPIQTIRFLSKKTLLDYDIEIQLAPEIPACCGVSDGPQVEFHGEDFYQRIDLAFEENRAGHLLKGEVTFPKPGAYGYRITGRILGRPFFREGSMTAVIPISRPFL